MIFETFDQSDQKTWPYPKIPTYVPTYLPTYPPTYLITHWATFGFLTLVDKTFYLPVAGFFLATGSRIFSCYRAFMRQMTILQTCDNWDTDYNSYNWEPEFMTIFFMWQSRVTVDSIRNSCDVFFLHFSHLPLSALTSFNHFQIREDERDIGDEGKTLLVKEMADV